MAIQNNEERLDACRFSTNEEERQIYEVRMQTIAEVESKIASALEQGKQQAAQQIALKLLDQGVPR